MRKNENPQIDFSPVPSAVEILTAVAEIDIDASLINAKPREKTKRPQKVISDKELKRQNIQWLNSEYSEAIKMINGTFDQLLSYLKYWSDEDLKREKNLESVKSIMVVVGEAAKKFDRYRSLIDAKKHKSITALKPYKKLQNFYRYKVTRSTVESAVGKRMTGVSKRVLDARHLAKESQLEALQARHSIVDLEAVKRDSEYELFFICKEDGNHYYNSRLIKNMKLASSFGENRYPVIDREKIAEEKKLATIHADRLAARQILLSVEKECVLFYRTVFKFKNKDLVSWISKALMALMLSADPDNVAKTFPAKNCTDYWRDFVAFLRSALHSLDYHKLLAYPPSENNIVDHCLINLIEKLSFAIYTKNPHLQCEGELIEMLIPLAQKAIPKRNDRPITAHRDLHYYKQLTENCEVMREFLHLQLDGPLSSLLERLNSGDNQAFDPFMLDNWPSALFKIAIGSHTIHNLYLPSPTHQEYINKASVVEEFKAFLRHYKREGPKIKHLLINLQNRSSWQECFRSKAIEELQLRPEYEDNLVVMTLAKESDFYHQLEPYSKENHAERFLSLLCRQLTDKNCGFYFPSPLDKKTVLSFAKDACSAIHRIFFSDKNILLREHRLDFIEIFYLFLILKIIDTVKPATMSITCKDGIDTSCSSNALLYFFMKMLSHREMDGDNWRCVESIIYTPSLMMRERTMRPEVFKRMASALKAIEFSYREHGHHNFGALIREAFGHLYDEEILAGNITPTP